MKKRIKLAKLAIQCCPELRKLATNKKQLIKALRNISEWLPKYLDKCERKLGRKADKVYDKARLKYPDKVTKDGFRRAFCLFILFMFLHMLPEKWYGSSRIAIIYSSILQEFFSLLSVEYNCWIEYQIIFNLYEQGTYILMYYEKDPRIIRHRFESLLRHLVRALSYRITKSTSHLKWLVLLINSIWHAYHNLRVSRLV